MGVGNDSKQGVEKLPLPHLYLPLQISQIFSVKTPLTTLFNQHMRKFNTSTSVQHNPSTSVQQLNLSTSVLRFNLSTSVHNINFSTSVPTKSTETGRSPSLKKQVKSQVDHSPHLFSAVQLSRPQSMRRLPDTSPEHDVKIAQFMIDAWASNKEHLDNILQQWMERPMVVQRKTYQKDQQLKLRFVKLGVVSLPNRADNFETIAQELKWAPSTQERYWAAVLSARKDLSLPIEPQDKALMKIISTRLAFWEPKQAPVLQLASCARVAHLQLEGSDLTLARLILISGIRPLDLARVLTRDVVLVQGSNVTLVAITIRIHKTIFARVPPYTIHLHHHSETARRLLTLAQTRKSQFLFLDFEDPPWHRQALESINKLAANLTLYILKIWQAYFPELGKTSSRRTVIQELGLESFPPQDIMLLSRHKSLQSLYKYAAYGRTDLVCGVKTAEMLAVMEDKLE